MATETTLKSAIRRRAQLLKGLHEPNLSFEDGGKRILNYLEAEFESDGPTAIIEHLYTCGVIPEALDHDSSEEKLYSKYTDCVIALAFVCMGFKSVVVEERGNSADVDVDATDYSFVADGKAFRLSRTAKNQKDFKVESMDGWRKEKDYATVVAPIFQFPSNKSQIYEQGIRRGVCLLSYTHLQVLVRLFAGKDKKKVEPVVKIILAAPKAMSPGSSAVNYWRGLNEALYRACADTKPAWAEEYQRTGEALAAIRRMEIESLKAEAVRIEAMDKESAVKELIEARKLPQRIQTCELQDMPEGLFS
jgi:hypothetical protein